MDKFVAKVVQLEASKQESKYLGWVDSEILIIT